MKFARIINGSVFDTVDLPAGSDPAKWLDPALGYVQCPDNVEQGWRRNGAIWSGPPAPPPESIAPAVKIECGRRIMIVLKDTATQTNINSYLLDLVMRAASGGALSADEQADVTLARALKSWVGSMQDKCRALIAAADASYTSDAHWPAAPAGGRAFADRF